MKYKLWTGKGIFEFYSDKTLDEMQEIFSKGLKKESFITIGDKIVNPDQVHIIEIIEEP